MPAKKTYRKKRNMRKRAAQAKRSKKAKNMDTYALTCKFAFTSIPIQGVIAANYIYHNFQLMNQASTYDVANNAEFTLFKNIYDQVRINSVYIKVTPKANTLSQAESQYDGVMNLTGDGLIHSVIDRDGNAPWTIGALTKYSSYRKHNQKKAFSRGYKITYPKGVWLDCQDIYADTTLLTRLGATGGITIYGENFPEDNGEVINEPWADIHVYYNVVFRGKAPVNLSYNGGTGEVTLSPIELGERPAESTAVVTSGAFNNYRVISTTDASGLVVAEVDQFATP